MEDRARSGLGFTLVTVFAAYEGEDYADIPAVARTVGFVPPDTRAARLARTLAVSDFAAQLGVASIACHVGFVPEDAAAPGLRRGAPDGARRSATMRRGTGRASRWRPARNRPHVLLEFIRDVDRANLRINFDPANLILYGTGEPIAALQTLAPLVISVHCKDGDWPAPGVAGALGMERPLGKGSVGIARFVETLRKVGFRGPLNVERETEDQQERIRDLAEGVRLLRALAEA